MKKCCTAVAAILLFCSSPMTIADNTGDPIIVTATRMAQTADESLASVTVITRDDIQRQQAQSVQDLLRGVPGLSIANNGGAGKTTSLFLRGTEADHLLVLIDGVRVGSATLGTTAFQNIPVEQIERIEIVRGPRSSLYGSEAIGGVIQIFMRKGEGDIRPFASIGGGSYNTVTKSVGVSGGGDRGWFSLSTSEVDTDGFNACNGKPSPGGVGCFTSEPDKDGYRSLSTSLHAGYRFSKRFELELNALRSDAETDFDGSFVNQSDSRQQVLGTTMRVDVTDIWQLSLIAGRSQDDNDNFKDGAFKSSFETARDTISLQNDLFLDANQVMTLGYDYQDDGVSGTTAYTYSSRNNKGLFMQYQRAMAAHDLQLSVRRDDNEQFGENSTGGVAWGYALNDKLRTILSYGAAFRAPTFNELYYPGYGNARLAPEESNSVELGLRRQTKWGRWALTAYQTKINDLIAYDAISYAPNNINQTRIRGIEAELDSHVMQWDLNASLSLLDPENRSSGPNNGKQLARRSQQSLRLDADRRINNFHLGATLFTEAKRYDDFANTRLLGGYATIDLRAEYVITSAWRLQARVANLLDKNYETAAYFNQAGRSLFLTLRYQP